MRRWSDLAAPLMLLLVPLAAGCKPNLGSPPSLVTGPRILAVRGTPPEASEGGAVNYDVLAVDVMGRVAAPDIEWLQCLDPDSPAEVNDVSNACLGEPDDPGGPSPTFMAQIASNACMLFGPETPSPMPGQPPQRPTDPDTTGGFYQPIRATWQSTGFVAFALERITCPLIQAPGADATQFAMSYIPNNNPLLADLVLDPTGANEALYTTGQAAMPPSVTASAGKTYTLQADFTADSAETFLYWDIVSLMLIQQRESLRVSWFATDGTFDLDTTGLTSQQAQTQTFVQNTWTAPTTPGTVHLWAVLNDSRGGVDFASAEIDVTP